MRALVAAALLCALAAFVLPWGAGAASTADPVSTDPQPAPNAGHEVPEARTETSRTFVDADGGMRTRVYAHPVNFRDAGGTWQKIDSRLVVSGEPGVAFANAANRFRAELPDDLTAPVRVENDGAWLEHSLVGASGDATAEGDGIVYADALDGADVRYRALPEGLKEDLVLESTSAPRRFAYRVRVSDGLSPRQADPSTVVFENADGEVPFAIEAPLMYDSAGAVSDNLELTLVASAGDVEIELVPDGDWLASQDRAYPVTVDPTIQTVGRGTRYHGADQECTIAGGPLADTNLCAANHVRFGWDGAKAYRALLKFNVVGAVPRGSVILDAHIGGLVEQQSGSSVSQIEVRRITRSWSTAATWNSRDGANAWTTPGGNASAKLDDEWVANYGLDWYVWDDLRETVDDWVNDGVSNYGLMLRAAEESSTGAVNVFSMRATQGDSTGDYWPYMDIHHEPRTGAIGAYTLDRQQLGDRMQIGVNVANGNVLLQTSDLNIAGRAGHDLSFGRYYNTAGRWNTDMSDRWRSSTGRGICLRRYANGNIALDGPTGWTLLFEFKDGSYKAPPGVEAKLVSDGSAGMKLTWNRSGEKMWFNSADVLYRHEDRNGNATVFHYNATDKERLESITDSQGRTITVGRDSGTGYIGSLTDPTGRSWQYGYDAARNLVSATDPDGEVTSYEYDSQDRMTAIVDPRGNRTELTYSSQGPGWRVGTLKRVVDGTTANDVKWVFQYYSAANTTSGATCDASQHILKTVVTDPRGNQTTHCSDRDGQVTRTVDANGRPTKTSYTSAANVQDFTDGVGTANEALSTLTYDEQGTDPTNNLTGIDQPAGENSTIDYWADNVNDPLARYRPKKFSDADGASEFYDYDTNGNLTRVRDAELNQDVRNEAVLTYNADGTVATAKDGRGSETTYGYDTSGNLTSVTPPTLNAGTGTQLAATAISYDSLSRVLRVSQDGKWREHSYDKLDRLTKVDFSDGSSFTYSYDANGNLTGRTDSVGPNASTYTYDKLNRRTAETLAGQTTSYSYDKLGNLTSVTDGGGTAAYGYDAINRTSSIADGQTITIDYDDTGAQRAEIVTFPGGTTQRTESDGSGKPVKIEAKNSGGTVLSRLSYAYDYTPTGGTSTDGSKRRSVTELGGNVTTYTYDDPVGRLTRATTKTSGGSTLDDYVYVYDAAGNRRSKTVNGTPTTYRYNKANQLCWSIQAATSNSCANPPSGATTYTYDGRGNQTAAGSRPFEYDVRDRTTKIGSTALGYLSAGQGELISEGSRAYTNNLLGIASTTAGGTTTWFRHRPSGQPITQKTGTTHSYFLTDALGSTTAVLNSSGSIVRSYQYTPDGEDTTTGSGISTILRYAGGHKTDSGLYHYGARLYDPAIGRWTQPDPLDQTGDLREGNRYIYVGADPINAVDSTGMLLDDLFGDDGIVADAWNCVNPVSSRALQGAAVGAGIGFTAGTASALELGPGALGVGAVSGAAGANIGYRFGSIVGCGEAILD